MEDIFTALAPVVADLQPTRSRLSSVFDEWLKATGRTDPTNFCHAVVWAAEELSHLRPEPGRSADALRLALATLGTRDAAYGCFAAFVGSGLFDHQVVGVSEALARMEAEAPKAYEAVQRDNPIVAAGGVSAAVEMDDTSRSALWRQMLLARALTVLGVGDVLSRIELQSANEQAMTRSDDFWTDPGTLLPAIMHGRRRLCIIETFPPVGREEQGTGFLIGPSAVLTNLHVVDALPDQLDDPSRLEIRFDFSDTTALAELGNPLVLPEKDWCLAKGELSDRGPEDQEYWWDDDASRAAWLDICGSQLDFAVIRLAEAPGLRRGWYPLSTARRRRPVGTWALHHPDGNKHTLTRGGVKYPGDMSKRLFHTASTVPGSSGGLILDQNGDALGLHYAGIAADRPPDPNKPHERHQVLNVAMTLRQIAKRLDEQNLLEEIKKPSLLRPPRGVLSDARPVFGRMDFFEALSELWRSETVRILRVDITGTPEDQRRSGKSFSDAMLRAVFQGAEHHHILLRAGDVKVDAKKAAEAVLESFAKDLVETMPSEADTTTAAYVSSLVAHLGRAISERLGDKTVWITLDDLDKHGLADASGREFLATLYAQVADIENLRIVLIGLPAGLTISGIAPETERVTLLSPTDAEDLREAFIAWMQEFSQGRADIATAGYDILGGIAASVAAGASPLEAMSSFAENHVAPLLHARANGSSQ